MIPLGTEAKRKISRTSLRRPAAHKVDTLLKIGMDTDVQSARWKLLLKSWNLEDCLTSSSVGSNGRHFCPLCKVSKHSFRISRPTAQDADNLVPPPQSASGHAP